jgi:hypothetical protein
LKNISRYKHIYKTTSIHRLVVGFTFREVAYGVDVFAECIFFEFEASYCLRFLAITLIS